jgi:predicted transcriptional regulator of viral defense system
VKKKTLTEIKHGEQVVNLIKDASGVTYDWVLRQTGFTPKQVQKVLADLCKFGYISKYEKTVYRVTVEREDA